MEELYRKLIDALPDIVYQIDPEGRFIYINDSISMIGYRPVDLLGSHFSVIFSDADTAHLDLQRFSPAIIPDAPPAAAFFNERRTGKRITRNLRVVLEYKRDANGLARTLHGEVFATGLYAQTAEGIQHIGTLGIIRIDDDHDNRGLLRLEQYYQLLLEHSMEITMVIAHDGTILYASNSVRATIGQEPLDLIGENILEIVASEDAFTIRYIIEQLIAPPGSINRLEVRMAHPHLGVRYFAASITAIRSKDHTGIMCYVLHATDISDRKQMETALEKRERLYKSLLKASPDAIVLFDKEGDIILANDCATTILAASSEELIGRHFLDLLCTGDHETARNQVTSLTTGGAVACREYALVTTDNRSIPVEASISVIRDAAGNIEGFISIFRDISSRKKLEAERRELQKELLELVFSKLSGRELELLQYLSNGMRWPEDKRLIGKKMDVLPGTLDQFVARIKKKMNLNDIQRIAQITSKSARW